MRKAKIILLVLGVLIAVAIAAYFLIGFFKPKVAGISIETTPQASVYIDGAMVGRTPYQGTQKPGEITVKLVPESNEPPLIPFEAKVNLVSGIETIIRRDFGVSEQKSGGEIISFEKAGGGGLSLAVISIPDSVAISIDGRVQGFSPYKTSSISEGSHQLIFSSAGYLERNLSVTTHAGYKLTVIVKLAETDKSPEPETLEEVKVTMVEILPTDTGFLRVRSDPGVLGSEIAQVKPGEKYLFLEEDTETGWLKIEIPPLDSEKEPLVGWVSGEFAKKVE